jgi:hypothetical protein
MKRFFSLVVSIFVVVLTLSCSLFSNAASPNTGLAATNQALSIQATIQQGIIGTQSALNQGPGSSPSQSATLVPPPETSTATAAPVTTGAGPLAAGMNSDDFTLNQQLPFYNLHVVAANGFRPVIDGITLRNIVVKDWASSDSVIGERWFAITTPLGVGKHTVKSGGGAQWEIWPVGTPPVSFSVHSTGQAFQAGIADYFFQINRQGLYQIKMDVLSGAFVVYIGCGYTGAGQLGKDLVVFSQAVVETSSFQTNLKPGICFVEVATSPNSNNPAWKISIEDGG